MRALAAVLEDFNRPLVWHTFEIQPPEPGELVVQVEAAGICGSDLHMWEGHDPRTPLPIILGHEAVGRVVAVGGKKCDILGQPVREGDLIAWDRGITCGECYYCVVRKQPFLCLHRRVYGINLSCAERPYLLGGYAEYMHLLSRTNVLVIGESVDPALLAPASCSGATAAHAVESAEMKPGDTVIVQGPGPLGLFATTFALEQGAGQVIVVGTKRSVWKLEIARRFGASEVVAVDDDDPQEAERIRALTSGRGADVVIECSGAREAMEKGLAWVATGGVYVLVGAAVPVGDVPVAVYENVVRKNARLLGVWVSDTSHFLQAIQLVLSDKYPFAELITHRFALLDVERALSALKERQVLKAVLVPDLSEEGRVKDAYRAM